MHDIEDVIDFYLSSKNTNDFAIKYLKRCRAALLAVKVLNHLFDLADPELVNEAVDNTRFYLDEVKDDRYYLKTIKKIMDKVVPMGVTEFETDFVALIFCLEIKNKHITDLENYYIEKIGSQVNNHGYPIPQEKDRIDEYNGKIDTLVLRLQDNSLDYKK